MSLTLLDAIDRALLYNLGVLNADQDLQSARGTRWRALAALLPAVDGRVTQTREQVSLAAFGASPGILPGIRGITGPFDVSSSR